MCVMIFIELCIMVNETVNFERLKIVLLKEHTTVIPRLTKIIRSGITFVSRNLR